jgi:hypothetical protein
MKGQSRKFSSNNSRYDLAGRTVLGEPAKNIRKLHFVPLIEDGSLYLETAPFIDSSSI